MTLPPANDPQQPQPQPQAPYGQPQMPYGQPQGPSVKKGLAIAALILGIVALVTVWVPILGVSLAVVGVILGIVAVVKKQPKGLGLTGLILSAVAAVVGLVVTIIFLVTIIALGTSLSESELTIPETVEPLQPESDESTSPTEGSAADFREVSDSEFAAIVANSDAHAGERITIYGVVDAFVPYKEGYSKDCGMTLTAGAAPQTATAAYEHYVIAYSGDWDENCPVFAPISEGDNVMFAVEVLGEEYYTNTDGSSGHAPQLEVYTAEIIG